MIAIQHIAQSLAERTNPEFTPDWDPTGLQLGDPGAMVESVAVCHEVTESVVAAVESASVDVLVSYHPLLFVPTNKLLTGRTPGSRAFRLIQAGVNLLITHTDFDAAPGGAADSLAGFFDLREVESFGADNEARLPAIGRVGLFQGTVATIDAMISDEFGHAGVRISGERERTVERLAVIPGSGSSLIHEAASLADAVVTGDVAHHVAVAALDAGLVVVDPGHTATERPGMSALVELVGEVSGLDVTDLTGFDPQTWS